MFGVKMSLHDRIEFWCISFMHDTMYGLFMDADQLLIPAGLKADDKVLEVGCGPGFFTIPAAKIVGEKGLVYAIDINPFAIKKVEKKIEKSGVKNVKATLTDVAKTNLMDNSLDLAFIFGTIHSLMDILDSVNLELHRILRQEGTIAIQKSWKSKEDLIDEMTKNNLFKFIEEKKRLLIFRKVNKNLS